MKKIIVVAGPTASGKTPVAVALAKQVDGEVISADSMQIYEGMDIGTAKPTQAERENIPHHMIDIIKPDEAYSAALYQQQARAVINDIYASGRIPILCGGTGFYINAVLNDINFVSSPDDEKLRDYFTDMATSHGPEYLYAQLHEQDPKAAAAIHPNNTKRVIRALSYISATKQLFSKHNEIQKKQPQIYEAVFFCLHMDRPTLYQRINDRVLTMFDTGLADEVAGLLHKGYHPSLVSMQGIGYKETIDFLQGKSTKAEAIAIIQQNSRHYAKRQMTWFRHQNQEAVMISSQDRPPAETALEIAKQLQI